MENKIIIISGPSGAGKGTLAGMLLKEYKNKITGSVSVTDRPIRLGETNGINYYFVTPAKFQTMKKNGDFLEHEEYQGKNYGTSKKAFEKILKTKNVLLEIDVKGAKKVMEIFSKEDLLSIFIYPPSLDVLNERLIKRADTSAEAIQERLKIAQKELKYQKFYKKSVVNDDLQIAYQDLIQIIKQENII